VIGCPTETTTCVVAKPLVFNKGGQRQIILKMKLVILPPEYHFLSELNSVKMGVRGYMRVCYFKREFHNFFFIINCSSLCYWILKLSTPPFHIIPWYLEIGWKNSEIVTIFWSVGGNLFLFSFLSFHIFASWREFANLLIFCLFF